MLVIERLQLREQLTIGKTRSSSTKFVSVQGGPNKKLNRTARNLRTPVLGKRRGTVQSWNQFSDFKLMRWRLVKQNPVDSVSGTRIGIKIITGKMAKQPTPAVNEGSFLGFGPPEAKSMNQHWLAANR